jgi:hypothetical protein
MIRRSVAAAGWFLIVAALLFAFLWLSEDLPALISGSTPQSVMDMGLPTNPVHVLDLGFFLPAAMVTGVLLLKRKPLGYTLAPALIVFLILTGMPILITPAVQSALGQTPVWSVLPLIGVLSAALLALLIWLMVSIADF